jgi:hypothetical protein
MAVSFPGKTDPDPYWEPLMDLEEIKRLLMNENIINPLMVFPPRNGFAP